MPLDDIKRCFVCTKEVDLNSISYNKKTNLPVCLKCKGSEAELNAEKDVLDSLSEGFVCGCI